MPPEKIADDVGKEIAEKALAGQEEIEGLDLILLNPVIGVISDLYNPSNEITIGETLASEFEKVT